VEWGLTALVLARSQRRRRKREALHLSRLGQQWPSGCLGGHLNTLTRKAWERQREARRDGRSGRVSRRGCRLSGRIVRLCAVVGRTTNCSNARAAVQNPQLADRRKYVDDVQCSAKGYRKAAKVLMYSSTTRGKSPQCRVTMDYTAADLGA
jgi:hypothetical protein